MCSRVCLEAAVYPGWLLVAAVYHPEGKQSKATSWGCILSPWLKV